MLTNVAFPRVHAAKLGKELEGFPGTGSIEDSQVVDLALHYADLGSDTLQNDSFLVTVKAE